MVIVDVDDFSTEQACLNEMYSLKDIYPGFKITLFTVPFRTDTLLLGLLKSMDWVETAVHGFYHVPNDECLHKTKADMINGFQKIDFSVFVKGFKPPGWYINENCIGACNEAGLWIALHQKDRQLSSQCKHGYYICGDRYDFWHGHTHNACGNSISLKLDELRKLWPQNQEFGFVSEAVTKNG